MKIDGYGRSDVQTFQSRVKGYSIAINYIYEALVNQNGVVIPFSENLESITPTEYGVAICHKRIGVRRIVFMGGSVPEDTYRDGIYDIESGRGWILHPNSSDYRTIIGFSEGQKVPHAIATYGDSRCCIIGIDGFPITGTFNSVNVFSDAGLAVFKREDRYGIVNTKGEERIWAKENTYFSTHIYFRNYKKKLYAIAYKERDNMERAYGPNPRELFLNFIINDFGEIVYEAPAGRRIYWNDKKKCFISFVHQYNTDFDEKKIEF